MKEKTKTSKGKSRGPREKLMSKIAERRSELVTEYFSKPKKHRKREIEQEIKVIDEQFEQLF